MYYVTVFISLVVVILAARLCVGIVGRVSPRWLRRIVFWLVVLPLASIISLILFLPVSDDQVFLASPSLVIAVVAPLLTFLLSLIGFALFGFRDGEQPKVPQARRWRIGRTTGGLIGSIVLLAVAIALFDWELRVALHQVKAAALDKWRNIPRPTVDDDQNAAISYLNLEQRREQLESCRAQFKGVVVEDLGYSDDQLACLAECAEAFDLIREGAEKPEFQWPRKLDYPDQLADDDGLKLLYTASILFRANLLARADSGDVSGAYDDAHVLTRVAKQLDNDLRSDGRLMGSAISAAATNAVERLLQFDSQPEEEVLRTFIDEGYNPRQSLPTALDYAEAEYIATMCNFYLGTPPIHAKDKLWELDDNGRPRWAMVAATTTVRLMNARDDLIATRRQSVLFSSFASRWDDPTATSDMLAEALVRDNPQGKMTMMDGRDFLFHGANRSHRQQRLMNLMVAATLFQKRRGRYPVDVNELIPSFLATAPICLTDGQPFGMRALSGGLIIYGGYDGRYIESDLQNLGRVHPTTARQYLQCTVFLGTAFARAYQDDVEPTSESSPSDSAHEEAGNI